MTWKHERGNIDHDKLNCTNILTPKGWQVRTQRQVAYTQIRQKNTTTPCTLIIVFSMLFFSDTLFLQYSLLSCPLPLFSPTHLFPLLSQQGKEGFLQILHRYMEVHGTVYYETQRPPEVPAFVKNHGLLPQHELQQLLRKAKARQWRKYHRHTSSVCCNFIAAVILGHVFN